MVRKTPDVQLTRDAFTDLRTAFRQVNVAYECFLDTETGRVICCSDHTAPVDGELDADVPRWVLASRQRRIDIWRDTDGRYLEVPAEGIETRWQDIQAFRRESDGPVFNGQFNGAPPNRHTIASFRRWLKRHPDQARRWRAFSNERTEGRIRSWLRSHGFGMTVEASPRSRTEK